jgi:D-alanyl-lipoteichoic acid acyltransferase DltB (MBOAT superfamily)
MSFLSFNFAIFLGLALLLFHFGPARWRPGLLLGLSYAFYLSWSLVYALLLAAVTAGVYATALWIEGRRTEKGKHAWMAVGVMTLLVLLFAFKSAAWFYDEFFSPLRRADSNGAAIVVVPLGLSYYVFKMVGYILDVYWEAIPAQRNFVSLALYGAFFPQIVSGPIQRAPSFFEQLEKIKIPDAGEFVAGLRRILFGLVKKVAIADRLAVLVGNVHARPGACSSLELLVGAYCYSIELYADFSAITDIAIGVGLLFGIRGPENFDLPYFSPNIQVFWRRWHISLTTWLGDYLFTPLRMSLRNLGTAGLCLAIFINMIAIGLWHGQTWTFLAFGIVNGIFLVVSVLTLKQRNRFFQGRPRLARVHELAAPLLTFHLVVLTHIFFRAETLNSALNYMAGLIPGWQRSAIPVMRLDLESLGVSAPVLLLCAVGFLASEAVTWASRRPFWVDWFLGTPVLFRRALYYALMAAVLLLFQGGGTFIYAGF